MQLMLVGRAEQEKGILLAGQNSVAPKNRPNGRFFGAIDNIVVIIVI